MPQELKARDLQTQVHRNNKMQADTEQYVQRENKAIARGSHPSCAQERLFPKFKARLALKEF